MSYDVNVWASLEPQFGVLPDRECWRSAGSGLVYESRNWMIGLAATRVEKEDLPDSVAETLPGIGWLIELALSPIGAPASARDFLLRAATAIAKRSHGVVEDKQTNHLRLPSGVKRFATPERDEKVSLLELTWWVNDSALRDKGSLNRLVDKLKASLPEAVARRYGEYEPPEFKLAERGEAHYRRFVESTATQPLGVVFYTTLPVTTFHLGNYEPPGPSKRGYRANCLSIGVDASALAQPGWPAQLRSTWEAISQHLRPFYSDVRVLRGYHMSRGRIWVVGKEAEQHPVRSWWWTGIPRSAPIAAVIGPPYVDSWKSVLDVGELKDGLVYLTSTEWAEQSTLGDDSWSPPEDIVAPSYPNQLENIAYPSVFPFETRLT